MQRNSDLQQFAHIVSHNVRGPLSTLLGLKNLLTDRDDDTDLEFITEGIGDASERLDTVIKDLNNILQLRREISEPKTNIDLELAVETVKSSIMQLIKEKEASISCNFEKAKEILTIGTYINNIIFNLVTNSIKFSKQNIAPKIKIWAEREDKKTIIYFKDNGTGIDLKKYGDRVFMLYNRFHHNIEGKGLGLFMTKTQVEALNGKIEMESTPGEGTLIKITFKD